VYGSIKKIRGNGRTLTGRTVERCRRLTASCAGESGATKLTFANGFKSSDASAPLVPAVMDADAEVDASSVDCVCSFFSFLCFSAMASA